MSMIESLKVKMEMQLSSLIEGFLCLFLPQQRWIAIGQIESVV